MTRGVRLSDTVRHAVANDLAATLGTPEGAIRRVAERHGVSATSVRAIREEYGLITPEDARAKTKNAAQQQAASNQERRAALAKRLLTVAEKAIDDMDKPALVYSFGGKENTYAEHLLGEPDFGGRKTLATIAAIAIDKSLVIEKHDAESGAASDFEKFQRWLTGGGTEG